jgi:hypothetical protein
VARQPLPAASAEPSKPVSAHDTPTLLEEHDAAKTAAAKAAEVAKEAAKAAEAKPAEPAKPAEEKPAEAKPDAPKSDPSTDAKPTPEPATPEASTPLDKGSGAQPVEYKYTLPETITMDDALKADVHAAFDAFRANPAEGAQKLLDMHAAQMQRYADSVLERQHAVFADARKGWRTEWKADPEIGGAGYDTSMTAIARARDVLVSSAKPGTKQYESDLQAFNDFMRITGVGDHPVFGRLLHNAARYTDEPQASSVATEIKPPKGNGRVGKGLYTHPSSANMDR